MARTDIKYGDFSFHDQGLPIPTIALSNAFNKTSAGALIGATTNITLNGKLIADGELNSDENWPNTVESNSSNDLGWISLVSGVTGLQYFFSMDYMPFDIKCNGQDILKLSEIEKKNTKVISINFANQTDKNWSQVIDYSIELQIERTGILDYFKFNQNNPEPHYVSSIENSYSITPITDQDFYLSIPTSIDATPPPSNAAFKDSLFPYATGDMYPGYTISRTLSATGKATKEGALNNAKHFVTGMLYFDVSFLDVIHNLTLFDRTTSIDANEIEGTYSVTDTFKAYSGVVTRPYTETFDINSSLDEKFNRTITINGKIKGLKTLDDYSNETLYEEFFKDHDGAYFFPTDNEFSDSYVNASGYFDELLEQNMFYNRVLSISVPTGLFTGYLTKNKNRTISSELFTSHSGNWINPIPLTSKADHNFIDGEISYSFSFDSRPLSLVSGAIREDISVSDDYSVRAKNSQVLYNALPLIQDLGTYTLPKRKVSYKGTFPAPIYGYLPVETQTQIINLIDNFNPNKMNPARVLLDKNINGRYYVYSWITDSTENFDPIQGSFTKNITWSYELRRPL